jgi:hypothetical protein
VYTFVVGYEDAGSICDDRFVVSSLGRNKLAFVEESTLVAKGDRAL